MTRAEIQTAIFEQTGIKTTVKKLTGSMKYHTCFSAMFQGGEYPKFPIEWRREFVKQFKTMGDNGNYHSEYSLDIMTFNIEEGQPLKFKKERKPKPIQDQSVREWGSQNSQLRLDKAASRYAKKRRGPNGDNMVKYW